MIPPSSCKETQLDPPTSTHIMKFEIEIDQFGQLIINWTSPNGYPNGRRMARCGDPIPTTEQILQFINSCEAHNSALAKNDVAILASRKMELAARSHARKNNPPWVRF